MDEDPSEEPVLTSSIACEPCRQKKCRCNRVLPVCGSCVSDPSKCWYSQGSKRGIPAGYISSLETRLAETEAALYYALGELHGGYREPGSYAPMAEHLKQRYSHGKTDVSKDWKDLPMTNRQQAQSWWLDRELNMSQRHAAPPQQQHGSSSRSSYTSGMPGPSGMLPVGQPAHASLPSWTQHSFPASEIQFQQQFQQLSTTPAAPFAQHGGIGSYHAPAAATSQPGLGEPHVAHYPGHPQQQPGLDPHTRHSSASSAEQQPGQGRPAPPPPPDSSGHYF